ncbi:unnamed protein product [Rotaria socialis]|uniref:Uncharacterized protein n=1 Tax=Rotaria socialis TaxID=392032 RepID=A0A818PJY8_9BILA|nr:unnamed protein product [Rotaria socialis]CAF4878506.1 unnamed protein product [Rotaria socialis]
MSIDSNSLPSPISKINIEDVNKSIEKFNRSEKLQKRKSIEHIEIDDNISTTKKSKSKFVNDPLYIKPKVSTHKLITHTKSPKGSESPKINLNNPFIENKEQSLKEFRIPKLVLNKIDIQETKIKFFGDSTITPIFNAFQCKINFSKVNHPFVSENFEFIKNRMWEELSIDQLAKDAKFIYVCSAGQCNWTARIGNKYYDINFDYEVNRDIVAHIDETEKFIDAIGFSSAKVIWLIPMVMDFKRFNDIKEKYDKYDLKNTKECILGYLIKA